MIYYYETTVKSYIDWLMNKKWGSMHIIQNQIREILLYVSTYFDNPQCIPFNSAQLPLYHVSLLVVVVEATTAKSGVILPSTPSDIAMDVASGGDTA